MGGKDVDSADPNLTQVAKASKGWFRKYMGDVSTASPTKQILAGGATGWLAGYVSMKVGKLAALAVGGSMLVLLLAHHNGYVNIDWKRVNRDLDQAKKIIEKQGSSKSQTAVEGIRKFAKDNGFFASGFVGGALIGIATS